MGVVQMMDVSEPTLMELWGRTPMDDKEREHIIRMMKENPTEFVQSFMETYNLLRQNKEYLIYLRSEYSNRLMELMDSGGVVKKNFDGDGDYKG